MAVALEREDVRREAIEEEAVMADDHGAAREILDRLFERAQRLDVEIVGRLVEQQDVAALA
jgi:selenophosphate synthetase-related protein